MTVLNLPTMALSREMATVVNIGGLVLVCSPLVYFWVVDPFIKARDDSEAELKQARDDLEVRVEERSRELLEERMLHDSLADLSPDAIVVHKDEIIEYANRSAVEMFGAENSEQLIGKNLYDRISPEFHDLLRSRADKLRKGDERLPFAEVKMLTVDNKVFDAEIVGSHVSVQGNDAVQSIIRDISARKEVEGQLIYQANYDELTELPNRVLSQDRLQLALVRAHRERHIVAVMFVDLDRFKNVNDSLGHSIGDLLLKQAARRLRSCVRDGDTVARLGGDEFLIILPDLETAISAEVVANKMLEIFSDSFQLEQHDLFITPSIGITVYPTDGEDSDVLLRNADAAMYQAKSKGRNTYSFFTSEIDELAHENLRLDNHLRHAMERNELLLHYQPIHDVKTGKAIGAEALLRWNNPQMGVIDPSRFIPVAEETGLITDIGGWVLSEACRQAAICVKKGNPDFRMSVNVSPRQFRDGKLVNAVVRALMDNDLPSHCLELEMTEGLLVEDAPMTSFTLRELKQMGVRLSIDDFGTGYSALSYLKRFPFDTLKIDRSFVMDVTTDKQDAALVAAIIAMSQSLELEVIGEGVETVEQLGMLRDHQCDLVQGYYYSKPLTADDLE
ncbi:MAG: putative bifunctional diguanylate cyclase/phosphodiesterase, partial [Alphaproteobacteria bacterium]